MVKRPTRNPDCAMYRKINAEILCILLQIEDYNEGMLETFWRLNLKQGE